MSEYEMKALRFAERYGIINYEVKGNKMIYKETFRGDGTYKAVVNLDTMKEERTKVKR